MRFLLVVLFLSALVAAALCQGESQEENVTPKKVLRKYRVRRPVLVDENGNIRAGPRVRRVRVKARPSTTPAPEALQDVQYIEDSPQVLFEEQQVVEPVRVVPTYRQATPSGTRTALLEKVNLRDRDRDDDRRPNVGTTRNYSHINENGSFTFGYEAEDGSFKEETRGTDCVVRGKYGYVDPDGIRREFSYVSGNPCDPNAPKEETQDDEADEQSIPPVRGGVRQRIPRPELAQNVLQGLEQTVEEKLSEEQLPALFRISPRQRRPTASPQIGLAPTTFRPRVRITQPPPTLATTQSPIAEFQQRTIPRQFLRPYSPSPLTPISQGVSEEPSQFLDRQNAGHGRNFNFDQELAHVQEFPIQVFTEGNAFQGFPARQTFPARRIPTQPTNAPLASPIPSPSSQPQVVDDKQQQGQSFNYANYRTELIYDPNSGQYTSILVQDIPKTDQEITLTQKLRGFVEKPQNQQNQFQYAQELPHPQVTLFPHGSPSFYHQQFGPHGNFHIQQQQSPEPIQQSPTTASAQYHQPQYTHANSPSTGQIDAFLRSLNLPI